MLYPQLDELIKMRSLVQRVELMARKRYSQSSAGNYASIFRGLGVEFETVRPYVVGDDVRHIDWRVTARVGKAHVKTFRAECERQVLVALDVNAYMRFGTRSTFKSVQAARIAAYFMWHCLQQQDRVGGLLFGDVEGGVEYFRADKDSRNTLHMLQAICRPQLDSHAEVSIIQGIKNLLQVAVPRSLVFLIADFSFANRDEFERQLLALHKRCTVILIAVSDAADQDIPNIGKIVCVNGNSNFQINTGDQRAREKYQAAWLDYKIWLTKLGKKYHSAVLWLDTNDDAAKFCMHATSVLQAWKN